MEIEFNCPILSGCGCLTPRVYWFSFRAQLQLQFVYTKIIYEFDVVWEMGNCRIGKNNTTIVHLNWMRCCCCCVQMNVHSACGTMSTAWEVFQLKLIELIYLLRWIVALELHCHWLMMQLLLMAVAHFAHGQLFKLQQVLDVWFLLRFNLLANREPIDTYSMWCCSRPILFFFTVTWFHRQPNGFHWRDTTSKSINFIGTPVLLLLLFSLSLAVYWQSGY